MAKIWPCVLQMTVTVVAAPEPGRVEGLAEQTICAAGSVMAGVTWKVKLVMLSFPNQAGIKRI